MATVIVFDVNETLIDLSALDPEFQRVFGDAQARKQWFKQLLELFLTSTIIDQYDNFDMLGEAALMMLADWRHVDLGMGDRARIREAMLTAPAYPDVQPALERLRAAGLRLVTLTNSTERSAKALLEHAQLDDYFDEILSADAVECYKPAPQAYQYAAKKLDVDAGDIRLVAAHEWDIAGALNAGCKAAFVARPEKALNPKGKQPDITGADLLDAAEQIVRRDA